MEMEVKNDGAAVEFGDYFTFWDSDCIEDWIKVKVIDDNGNETDEEEDLSLENFEVTHFEVSGSKVILWCYGGGDWQEPVSYAIEYNAITDTLKAIKDGEFGDPPDEDGDTLSTESKKEFRECLKVFISMIDEEEGKQVKEIKMSRKDYCKGVEDIKERLAKLEEELTDVIGDRKTEIVEEEPEEEPEEKHSTDPFDESITVMEKVKEEFERNLQTLIEHYSKVMKIEISGITYTEIEPDFKD